MWVEYVFMGIMLGMSLVAGYVFFERLFFYRRVDISSFSTRAGLERELTKGLYIIASVASNAPYVGLLGTVIGIMHTFQVMGREGIGDTLRIMVGLALALKATAMGLLVAIPAGIAYNYLLRRARDLLYQWEDTRQKEGSKDMKLDLRAFTLSFLVHSLAGFIAFQMIRFELVEKKVVELDLSMLEVRKEVHKDTSQKPIQSIRDKVEPQSPMRENTRERVETLPTHTSIKTVEREESKSQPLGVLEEATREETQEVKPTLSGEGIEPKDKGEVHAGQPIKEGSKTLGEASGAKPRELTSSDRHGGAGGRGEEDYSVLYSRQNFESIRSLVRSHLEYPTLARMRGWEGRVVVLICLEGRSLCGLSIKESSGYRVLDDAVIRAVQKAHRDFPFAERRVNLSLPVQFTLKEGS